MHINVGNVGIQNYYKCHKGTKQCETNEKKKKVEGTVQKTKEAAMKFFQQHMLASPVPSTITSSCRRWFSLPMECTCGAVVMETEKEGRRCDPIQAPCLQNEMGMSN